MLSVFSYIYWAYLWLALLVVFGGGYIAATASAGPRKGLARLVATFVFTSWFVLSPLWLTLYESRLPVFACDGVIRSIVGGGSSKYYSARLRVATNAGEEVLVHVTDGSGSWRVGQRVRMRYYGYTGELIDATLLNPDGTTAGVWHRTAPFSRAVLVIAGLFTTWAGVRRYRRDPEAASDYVDRFSGSSDPVDEHSLLHLAEDPSSERP